MHLKKSEVLYFNVDYIEVYASFDNCNKLFEGVDGDNSNMIQFGDFNLEKTVGLKNYEFKISFKYNNLTVFAYYGGKEINPKITTRDYFTVYGSAFTQFDTEEIVEFINMYLVPDKINNEKKINDFTLKRFDLALDIKRNIDEEVLKYFKDLNQKGADFYGTKGDIQTHYIGAYSVRDNKSFLIRIYNKIEDLKKKGIQYLYPEYLMEKDVTRVEIEFRSELTKGIKLDKLTDYTYLFNLQLRYLEKHTDIFESLKSNHVEKLKRLNKRIDIEELKYNQVIRQRYISAFKGYAKKILKIGACPIDILLRNQLISQLTLEDIPNCIKMPEYSGKLEYSTLCALGGEFELKTYCEGKTKRNELHRLNSLGEGRAWN